MRIYTLWRTETEVVTDAEVPWLVAAVDEPPVQANDGFPEHYNKGRADNTRELLVTIPDEAVLALFRTPVVKGTPVKE